MDERLQDSEKERQDLLHLQKNFKLTWIPDQLINECQQTKCRAPFSKVTPMCTTPTCTGDQGVS